MKEQTTLWCHPAREAGLTGDPKLSKLLRSSGAGALSLSKVLKAFHARLRRKSGRATQVTKTGAILETQ